MTLAECTNRAKPLLNKEEEMLIKAIKGPSVFTNFCWSLINNNTSTSFSLLEMSNGEYRHVWRIVFRNFINSFRPRQITGNNMGKDYIGNIYYEIPADPSVGKRKPSRWYDPPKGQDFQDPIPAEWESWLRMRRMEPPTEEEIAKNVALAKLKKENAAKIEAQRLADGGSLPSRPERGAQSFPTYSEYTTGDPEDYPHKKT